MTARFQQCLQITNEKEVTANLNAIEFGLWEDLTLFFCNPLS